MKTHIAGFCFVVLAVAAPTAFAAPATAPVITTGAKPLPPPPAPSPFNPEWRVIFDAAHASDLTHQCSRGAPGPVEGTWTPTPADIDGMEPELGKVLVEQLAQRRLGVSPGSYYRQYGGLIIGGRRVIYVNGFHSSVVARRGVHGETLPPLETWRTQAVGICDGGPIVFGVEYDPATKTFAHFAFNGSV